MATATLPHGKNPHLVAAHLGREAAWITRASDYLFDVDVDQAALDAAIAGAVAGTAPQIVPEEVDALAFELTLHSLGLLDAVTAYVATLPAVEQIYWRRRQTMRRDSALIEAGRVALGLTGAQVDSLFVAAGGAVV